MIHFTNVNLLEAPVDVLIQSNNCFNIQGTGVAKAIREKYPEVYDADCQTVKGDPAKLATILPVKLNNEQQPYYCFLNYNQYKYGKSKRQVNYESFYRCLEATRDKCKELGFKSIGLPYNMSCANAGGLWPICLCMIEAVFQNEPIDVYICKYEQPNLIDSI